MKRLRAEIKEAYPSGKDLVVQQFLVPEAMKEFFSYSFPVKYRTHESDYKTYMVWGLEMHGRPSYIDHETVIADRGERFLASFAYADGGNYYLAFDLKDSDPSDPAVFKIDHYDPEQRIYSGIPLSEFLADLMPETR